MSQSEAKKRLQVLSQPPEHTAPASNGDGNTTSAGPGVFVSTDLMNVISVANLCAKENQLGAVFGDPGSGKTTAIKEFIQRYDNVIYLTARPEMSVRDILDVLGGMLDIVVSGTNYRRVSAVTAELVKTPRMIIIDEAENLITYTTRKMEIFRELFDEAGIPMLLCGDLRLESNLTRGPSLKENLSRFYSRIRYHVKLTGLSSAEASEMVKRYPNIAPAAQAELLTYVKNTKCGSIRVLNHLIEICRSLIRNTGQREITLEIVKEAAKFLLIKGR
jgi:DNA transposition AAA+ family ATPase